MVIHRARRAGPIEVHSMRPVSIVVATDSLGGFGYKGKIPWKCPEDLKHFKQVTDGGICIMGRKTYDDMYKMSGRENEPTHIGSPPVEVKPSPILPNRESYVLSRNEEFEPVGAKRAKGLRQVVDFLPRDDDREIFILGGEKLFIEALPSAETIYMTVMKKQYKCDRFFPIKYLSKNYKIDSGEELDKMYFVKYIRA